MHFNSGLFNLIPTLLPVGTTTLHLFRWNQTSSAATRSWFFSGGGVYTRRDPAEGLEFEIPGRRDCAESLEFSGAKRRRKILGFMCTDAWERVHICEA